MFVDFGWQNMDRDFDGKLKGLEHLEGLFK